MMVVVALVMELWIKLVISMVVGTMVLAGDVMVVASGLNVIHNCAKALNAAHIYLLTMGAKIAPSANYNFATSNAARSWLAETWWRQIDGLIQVVKDSRYLGAHMSTTIRAKHTTLEDRII